MLVQGDQLAQHGRGQLGGQDGGGGPVAGEGAVRHQVLGDALLPYLLGTLAEGERLALGEQIGHQQVVLGGEIGGQLGDRPGEADEVGGDQLGPLVQQLEVGVLPVGAGRAPHHRPVCQVTGSPCRSTRLPLDSMSSCWR